MSITEALFLQATDEETAPKYRRRAYILGLLWMAFLGVSVILSILCAAGLALIITDAFISHPILWIIPAAAVVGWVFLSGVDHLIG